MKVTFFPKNKLGVWSVVMFILAVIAVAFFFLMVNQFGQRGGDTLTSNLSLFIPMLLAWIAGLLSFVFGLIAIFKGKSRAILLFIVVLISCLVTVYGVIEILFPH
jgi:hypothetical protein